MKTPYDRIIQEISVSFSLDPSLVQAFVCQESGGDPCAVRFEKGYYGNSVVRREAAEFSKKNGGIPTFDTELVCRSLSWGLGQIMGQVARESGLTDKFLSVLTNIENNIKWICILLLRRQGMARIKNLDHLIISWNQGPGCSAPSGNEPYLVSVKKFMRESPY
jgi:hypothetical protein